MSAAHPIHERRARMIEDLRSHVPHELRELSAWLLWKAVPKDGKPGEWDKVPFYTNGRKRHGKQGSDEDLEQLVDFPAVIQSLERDTARQFAGVGFAVLPCHPVTALDLDKVPDDASRQALADAVVGSGTYVEASPSGRGIRAFYSGKLGFGNVKNHAAGVEVFESSGFVTVTGAELSNGADLADMPDDLRERIAATVSRPKQAATTTALPRFTQFDLGQLPHGLAARLRRGFPEAVADRSAHLYGLSFALRRAGLDAAQALAVLGDPDLEWITPALERRGGDIESARDWVWRYCIAPAYAQPMEVAPPQATASAPTATPQARPWDSEPLDFLRTATAPPFNADDVPPELSQFACEWAAAAGFDSSGVIAATVAAAASAISDGIRLAVNTASNHYESARLWVLLIGPPGVAKSPSLNEATRPLKTMHGELFADWQAECARVRKAAEAADQEPELPPRPALYTTDVTTEALADVLMANPRGLMYLTEELEAWLGAHDAYRNGGGKDRGEWLRAYDGGPHQVDRVRRGSFFVPNWGVSVLTATTPTVLQKLSRKLPADGLLQRFIPVLVRPGGRADRRADVTVAAQSYHNTLARLYGYGPTDTSVRVVRATDEAADLLLEERERLRNLALAVQVYGDGLAGHVAKHSAMVARVALTFHAIAGREDPSLRRLDRKSVV